MAGYNTQFGQDFDIQPQFVLPRWMLVNFEETIEPSVSCDAVGSVGVDHSEMSCEDVDSDEEDLVFCKHEIGLNNILTGSSDSDSMLLRDRKTSTVEKKDVKLNAISTSPEQRLSPTLNRDWKLLSSVCVSLCRCDQQGKILEKQCRLFGISSCKSSFKKHGTKRYKRNHEKQRSCPYCQKQNLRMIRHFRACHKDRPEIDELTRVNLQRRRLLMGRIMRRSALKNYIRGLSLTEIETRSSASSVECARSVKRQTNDVVMCGSCFGMFQKAGIGKHVNWCREQFGCQTSLSVPQDLLDPRVFVVSSDFTGDVLSCVGSDVTGAICRSDGAICVLGWVLFRKLNRSGCDRSSSIAEVVSLMRKLGGIYAQFKQLENDNTDYPDAEIDFQAELLPTVAGGSQQRDASNDSDDDRPDVVRRLWCSSAVMLRSRNWAAFHRSILRISELDRSQAEDRRQLQDVVYLLQEFARVVKALCLVYDFDSEAAEMDASALAVAESFDRQKSAFLKDVPFVEKGASTVEAASVLNNRPRDTPVTGELGNSVEKSERKSPPVANTDSSKEIKKVCQFLWRRQSVVQKSATHLEQTVTECNIDRRDPVGGRTCPFCGKHQLQLVRHLLHTHPVEPEVKRLSTLSYREKRALVHEMVHRGYAVQQDKTLAISSRDGTRIECDEKTADSISDTDGSVECSTDGFADLDQDIDSFDDAEVATGHFIDTTCDPNTVDVTSDGQHSAVGCDPRSTAVSVKFALDGGPVVDCECNIKQQPVAKKERVNENTPGTTDEVTREARDEDLMNNNPGRKLRVPTTSSAGNCTSKLNRRTRVATENGEPDHTDTLQLHQRQDSNSDEILGASCCVSTKSPCIFCGILWDCHNMARHLKQRHRHEPEVRHLQKMKNAIEKHSFMRKIAQRGLFKYYAKSVRSTGSEVPHLCLKRMRRTKSDGEVIICGSCFGIVLKAHLARHCRSCLLRQRCTKPLDVTPQLLQHSVLPASENFARDILDCFSDDAIGQLCRTDPALAIFGKVMYMKSDCTSGFASRHVANAMHRLAEIRALFSASLTVDPLGVSIGVVDPVVPRGDRSCLEEVETVRNSSAALMWNDNWNIFQAAVLKYFEKCPDLSTILQHSIHQLLNDFAQIMKAYCMANDFLNEISDIDTFYERINGNDSALFGLVLNESHMLSADVEPGMDNSFETPLNSLVSTVVDNNQLNSQVIEMPDNSRLEAAVGHGADVSHNINIQVEVDNMANVMQTISDKETGLNCQNVNKRNSDATDASCENVCSMQDEILMVCSRCSGFFSRKHLDGHESHCTGFVEDPTLPSNISREFHDEFLKRLSNNVVGNVCKFDSVLVRFGQKTYEYKKCRPSNAKGWKSVILADMKTIASMYVTFTDLLRTTGYAPTPTSLHAPPFSPACSNSSYLAYGSVIDMFSCQHLDIFKVALQQTKRKSKSLYCLLVRMSRFVKTVHMQQGKAVGVTDADGFLRELRIIFTDAVDAAVKALKNRKTRYVCSLCGRQFTQPTPLKLHMKWHAGVKSHVCNECGKCFVTAGNLRIHARSHSGDKPYRCDECDKRFSQLGALKIHLRTHNGERPFRCTECDKRFTCSANLKVHSRTHSGLRPYACRCGLRFAQPGTLKAHQKIHDSDGILFTAEKENGDSLELNVDGSQCCIKSEPYCCADCRETFTDSATLKVHLRTHAGLKAPFKCPDCDKQFTHAGNLKVHSRTHTKERPYACKCGSTFTQSSSLKTHMKIHLRDKTRPLRADTE